MHCLFAYDNFASHIFVSRLQGQMRAAFFNGSNVTGDAPVKRDKLRP